MGDEPEFNVLYEDSSSGDEGYDDGTRYENLDCFFDEGQLRLMQLDDITIKREYIQVTCTNTINKQDQDHFRIETDICKWPHDDVTFQYLMKNLCLKQQSLLSLH